MVRILAFAGSTRRASLNKKLVREAARRARAAGADVTRIDLRDLPMPLYDGDLEAEEGMPEAAIRLRELMAEHDGLLLACPEYNASVTGVLKNAIDWVSRPLDGESGRVVFDGKVGLLLAASPGALGGQRGLVHVRAILGNLGVLLLPAHVAVPRARQAFSEDGELADERAASRLDDAVGKLIDTLRKLRAPEGGTA